MNTATVQAFFDELEKIARAREATEVGRLINADKDSAPTADVGGNVPKRQNRLSDQHAVTTNFTDPEAKTPEATIGHSE